MSERKFKIKGSIDYSSYLLIAHHNNHTLIDFGVLYGGINGYPVRYTPILTGYLTASIDENDNTLILTKKAGTQVGIYFVPFSSAQSFKNLQVDEMS